VATVEAPPPPPERPAWQLAAEDPNRSINPAEEGYWKRADMEMWASANPELAAAAQMRFRPIDRGALQGTQTRRL
jgi:hypothetical protein